MGKNADRAEMVIRLPRDIKNWLVREADENGSSQNSEIVRALRHRMGAEQLAVKRVEIDVIETTPDTERAA